jgi:hypothetical protein
MIDDNNDSCDRAIAVAIDDTMGATGALNPVGSDYDYFKFTGTAGQALLILTDAKPDADPFVDGYADTVLTIFDANGEQIAENDDRIPRNTQDSEVITVLPDDGEYCIRVGDFCLWEEEQSGTNPCPGGMQDVSVSDEFRVFVLNIDFGEPSNISEMEAVVEYEPNPNGNYYGSVIQGTFDSGTDNDAYDFTAPNDVMIDPDQRHQVFFDVYPVGPTGNGSSAPTGNVWVEDAAVPGVRLAQIDATTIDPTFGMTLEMPYVQNNAYKVFAEIESGATPGDNPFYVLFHGLGGSNPPETQDVTNDIFPGEPVTINTASSGAPVYWFSGDIGVAGVDVDHFDLDISGIATNLNVFGGCTAQRIGSGLREMSYSLLKGSDEGLIATITEDPDMDTDFGDMGLPYPTGEDNIVMKVEAVSQDPQVLGKHYRCFVAFIDPSS